MALRIVQHEFALKCATVRLESYHIDSLESKTYYSRCTFTSYVAYSSKEHRLARAERQDNSRDEISMMAQYLSEDDEKCEALQFYEEEYARMHTPQAGSKLECVRRQIGKACSQRVTK